MSAQAAARLLEIASTTPPSPQGRVYVEEVNAIFPREDGSPGEYRAAIEQLKAEGLIDMHDSGTYFTSPTRVRGGSRDALRPLDDHLRRKFPSSGNFPLALLHIGASRNARAREQISGPAEGRGGVSPVTDGR